MDILITEMSGKEVAQKIRKAPKTKNLKIVFLSVLSKQEYGFDELKDIQASENTQKPYTTTDLRKRIKKVLASE